MPGPWERYSTTPAPGGPWAKYGAPPPDAPNSFFGGAGRRLASMIQQPENQSTRDRLVNAVLNTPFGAPLKVAAGLVQSERQLGPQFAEQVRQAAARHQGDSPLQTANPFNVNLEDARAVTTGLSMLDPFASGSVGNVNQLQDEGRGREAAGQGTVDAALLATGLAAPKILPAARTGLRTLGRTMETNAPKVAEFAAHPVASVVRPVTRGAISTGGRLLQRMAGPEASAAAPSPAAPAPTETAAPTQSFSPQPLSAEPPASLTPSYFEAGATPKTNVPITRWSSRQPLLQDMRDFEAQRGMYDEMNAQQGSGEDAIRAEMERPGGAWRGKDTVPAPESGTWSADPRTGEEILQSVQNMRGGGQGKVAMQEGAQTPPVPVPRSSRPGFGTATVPIEERMDTSALARRRLLEDMGHTEAPDEPAPDPFADMEPRLVESIRQAQARRGVIPPQ